MEPTKVCRKCNLSIIDGGTYHPQKHVRSPSTPARLHEYSKAEVHVATIPPVHTAHVPFYCPMHIGFNDAGRGPHLPGSQKAVRLTPEDDKRTCNMRPQTLQPWAPLQFHSPREGTHKTERLRYRHQRITPDNVSCSQRQPCTNSPWATSRKNQN